MRNARPADRQGCGVLRRRRRGFARNGRAGRHSSANIEAIRTCATRNRSRPQPQVVANRRERYVRVHQFRISREIAGHKIAPRQNAAVYRQVRAAEGRIVHVHVLEIGSAIPNDVAIQISAATRRHTLIAPRGLVKIHRRARDIDHRVVYDRVKVPFLGEHRVIAIVEEVAYDGDLGRIAAVGPTGNRAGRDTARNRLVDIHKHIAFDVRVSPVEVEHVIARAAEHVVKDLQNRAGTLPAREIDNVVQPRRRSKIVALDNPIPARTQADAMNEFRAGGRWEAGVTDHERAVVERAIVPVHVAKIQAFEINDRIIGM